jgi:hypothetical protein
VLQEFLRKIEDYVRVRDKVKDKDKVKDFSTLPSTFYKI